MIRIPVGHGEGRFVGPDVLLDQLEREGQVVLRYAGDSDDVPVNPNGSARESPPSAIPRATSSG